jgi:hypothetical protein
MTDSHARVRAVERTRVALSGTLDIDHRETQGTNIVPVSVPLVRRPGRPKGIPKSPNSGRKKGTPNSVNGDIRELILREGRPIEFLCKVVQGRRIRVGSLAGPGQPEYVYPSFKDRLHAAVELMRKVVPDMREVSGPHGAPIETVVEAPTEPPTDLELAQRIAYILCRAARSAPEDDGPY